MHVWVYLRVSNSPLSWANVYPPTRTGKLLQNHKRYIWRRFGTGCIAGVCAISIRIHDSIRSVCVCAWTNMKTFLELSSIVTETATALYSIYNIAFVVARILQNPGHKNAGIRASQQGCFCVCIFESFCPQCTCIKIETWLMLNWCVAKH